MGITRKDFSKKERIDYARRLERIEKVKAQQRMSLGGKGGLNDGTQNFVDVKKGETLDIVASKLGIGSVECENFPIRENGRTSDIVAQKLGIGSGKQYEKEKYIADNANPTLLISVCSQF